MPPDQAPERPQTLPRGHVALPPEYVDANQRARLIAAMTTVVGRQGFRATSLADLTPVARVSRGAFYARYENLEACFAAAFDAGAARLLAAVAEADDPGVAFPARVEAALAAALDLLASDPALARLLFAEFLPREQATAECYRLWGARLLDLLHAASAADSGTSELPEPVERALLGGLLSVVSEAARLDPERLPELAPALTAFVAASYGYAPIAVPPTSLAAELCSRRELPAAPAPSTPTPPADPLDMDGLHRFSQQRTRADQHQRLLTAATELIAADGCAKLNARAAAEVAGTAPRVVRALFGDREGLLAATFEPAADRLLLAIDASYRPEADFTDQLQATLRAALDLLASDPNLAALLALDFLPGSEALPDRYYRLLWRLAARLRFAAVERGLEPPAPLLARVIVGGLAATVAADVGEGRLDRLSDLAAPLASWVASLSAPPSPA